MSTSKRNSYRDRWFNPYMVFIGGGSGVEGACKTSKIIIQEKLFNPQKKLIQSFLANW